MLSSRMFRFFHLKVLPSCSSPFPPSFQSFVMSNAVESLRLGSGYIEERRFKRSMPLDKAS